MVPAATGALTQEKGKTGTYKKPNLYEKGQT